MTSTSALTAVPAWRAAVKSALKRNGRNPTSKFVQVATIRASDGAPAVRTVVFRGFWDDFVDDADADRGRAHALVFCTDARSEKINDVARDARAEMAWYFPETREQFRVTGTLTCATSTSVDERSVEHAARVNLWRRMRRGARGQFLWPTPGGARVSVESGESDPHDVDESDSRLDDDVAGEHFALVAMRATRVDHLHLKRNERVVYEETDGEWTATRVNP